MDGQDGKSSLSSEITAKLQGVKIYSISMGKVLLVLLNIVVDCVETWGTALQRLGVWSHAISSVLRLLDMSVE